ncbi:UvrD-helicase domain-containing protein [Agarivorans sp. DSG3-1]|uniref:UvrD-helicase domain-containing protein n=1 Tax=Agarivorans sp. DSG3-1 TaxID=3342249 RepID=UPI00398F835C
MSQNLKVLKTNLIGRLLGSSGLTFDSSSLELVTERANTKVVSLSELSEFFSIKRYWFGAELSFDIDGDTHTYRFLKNAGIDDFVDTLNELIAVQVSRYLSKNTSRFEQWVIHEYPRQSRLEELTAIITNLKKGWVNQKRFWDKYIDSDLTRRIRDIVGFYPLKLSQLQAHHEKVQLDKRSDFFDCVESNPLTHEQRLGVLRSNDLNMVLAAAGTGKTSVMVAKALDLIDRELAKPSDILILAYNKAAANELKERLADKAQRSGIALESSPHISTFHSLGREILKESKISTYLSVFVEDELKLKQWLTDWLVNYLSSDLGRLVDFISLSPEPTDPFNINTQAEYEAYVRDNELRTLSGELVKGYQELVIANFLYLNGVPYTYEARYVTKRRIEVGFDYTPDFHINGTDIYIEHFGVDRQGGTRADIDAEKYNEEMESKRALHLECETTLVETYHYEWVEETLTAGLEAQLKDLGVEFSPIDADELLSQLKSEGKISDWSDLLHKALSAIRVERLDEEGILARLQSAGVSQPHKYTSLLSALQDAYVQELERQDAIDFDDMIIRSISALNSHMYRPTWRYLLVDEFQDISASRMELVKSIVEQGPSPSLTVVGDDWQSIYRFSGGKLELTTRFEELVGEYTSSKLQKTFRYNNSIADTAGLFIMENPEQYKKHIETHTQVDSSQVYLLDDKVGVANGLYERVTEVVAKIRSQESDASIAVIGRYNYLLNESREALKQSHLDENVAFWSFHKSKGLEADYCILIGFSQGKLGFPNENKDQAVVEALLPTLDDYPHSEERRLLYVGLTRAKKKSYIIGDPSSPSAFITELLAPKYEVNIHSKAFQERYRKIFKCPNCEEGYLKLINGKFGAFYSCSTGRGCKVGKARVCSDCGAPSIDKRFSSDCNNQDCGHTFKICEKCGRPMKKRTGKYGEFWGCSGYGIENDQCKNTVKP